METGAPPDGYRRASDGVGITLIDPTDCPAGHPFRFGTRQNLVHCHQHGRHLSWRCACSTWIYRGYGRFVAQLDCVRPAEPQPDGPA